MLKRKKKGQSLVEYILLLSIVIAIVFVFLKNTFSQRYAAALNQATNGMDEMANRLRVSRP